MIECDDTHTSPYKHTYISERDFQYLSMCFYVSVNNSTTQLRVVVIKNTSNKIKGLLRAGMTRAESAFLKIACTVFPSNLKAYLLIF